MIKHAHDFLELQKQKHNISYFIEWQIKFATIDGLDRTALEVIAGLNDWKTARKVRTILDNYNFNNGGERNAK